MSIPSRTKQAVQQPGPRPRRGLSWAERQRRARRHPVLRQLQNSFGWRVLLAACAAGLLLAAVNRWENCRSHGFSRGCVWVDQGGVISVGNVEAFSIVTAGCVFLLERGKRRQQENLEAMEVVLACQQAEVRFSEARNQALERLSSCGLWLDGLNLSGAQLQDLQAPHGRWRGVSLHNSCLRNACLHDADLQGCDLRGADLQQANLQHADLRNADLREADLRGADLRHADLGGSRREGALLDGALLDGALLADSQ